MIIPAKGDKNLISYTKELANETFLDKDGKIIPMKAFRYLLRIMASCARSEECVSLFVRDPVYLDKLLCVMEDIQQEETISNCLKIFRICMLNENYTM